MRARDRALRPLVQGSLTARLAQASDWPAINALRQSAFPRKDGRFAPQDHFDAQAWQIIVEEAGRCLAAFRLLPFARGSELGQSYSAQFYDLSPLARFDHPLLEVGRFCLADHPASWQALRLAWGAVTRIVDDLGVARLIGCSSFKGCQIAPHLPALALLQAAHIGPRDLIPLAKSPHRFDLPRLDYDHKSALCALPSVLRSYLGMGGWTSDHAVIDADLDTLHVFTCVDVAAIPPERVRLLRQIAQNQP